MAYNYECLKCNKEVDVYGCRFCDSCYYPGIDDDYNEYQGLIAEGHSAMQAAVLSGYEGAEKYCEGEADDR